MNIEASLCNGTFGTSLAGGDDDVGLAVHETTRLESLDVVDELWRYVLAVVFGCMSEGLTVRGDLAKSVGMYAGTGIVGMIDR